MSHPCLSGGNSGFQFQTLGTGTYGPGEGDPYEALTFYRYEGEYSISLVWPEGTRTMTDNYCSGPSYTTISQMTIPNGAGLPGFDSTGPAPYVNNTYSGDGHLVGNESGSWNSEWTYQRTWDISVTCPSGDPPTVDWSCG